MNEFEKEKEHLNEVSSIIKRLLQEQRIKIEKLKMIRDSLSYEDMKRGDALHVNTIMNGYQDEVTRLEKSQPSPYFGNFDFKFDENNETKSVYIGKFNVMDEDKIYVTDWRTPICSLYYDGNIGNVSYQAPSGIVNGELLSKKQIIIEKGELKDVIDTTTVTSDELLKPYLNSGIDNNMKTIIASIQKEQNDIIRMKDTNIIVQGVAGSGKTSVALHRIAYLLYAQNGKLKSDNFLVIGPNKYFLKYISTVLPDLATTTVNEKTILEVMNDYLDTNLELDDNLEKDSNKGMEQQVHISEFKGSMNYLNLINNFLKNYIENDIVKEDFKILDKVIFTKEEIRENLLNNAGNTINFDKTIKYYKKLFKDNKRLYYYRLNKEYEDIYTRIPIGDPSRTIYIEKSNELKREVETNGEKALNKYLKNIVKNTQQLYLDFIDSLDESKTGLTNEELLKLKNSTSKSLKKKKVLFEDIAPLMYINSQLTSKKYPYTNIIIDEAQDYSELTFYTLKSIFNNCKFNIYGDIAQGIKSYRGIKSWAPVINKVFDGNCNYYELNRSYRSTLEITNVANNILNHLNLTEANPVIRTGERVEFEEKHNSSKIIEKINDWISKGYTIISVICKDDIEALKVCEELREQGIDIKYFNKNSDQYANGVISLSVETAKGLEFDCTIVHGASPDQYNINNEVDMKLLYVALTRGLHEEMVLYNKELVDPLKKELGKVKTLKM